MKSDEGKVRALTSLLKSSKKRHNNLDGIKSTNLAKTQFETSWECPQILEAIEKRKALKKTF